MYSTASRLRPAVVTLAHPYPTLTAGLMGSSRSYATGSKNFTDVFANNWTKFKSMLNRQKEREEMIKEKEASAAPATGAASPSSDEAAVRKAREAAKLAAVERAKAQAKAKRDAEAAKPPAMTVDEVIRAVLNAEGIAPKSENRVSLEDLKLKGKLVAGLVSEARIHLSHADMTRARTVGELRVLAKAAGQLEPVVKHPVAAWFEQQQEAGKLPPNVQFVAYSKKDKLKMKEMY